MSRVYLGTQGWSYSSWVGPFYPPGTPANRYLEHYATQFNTVELDTTFYAMPRESAVAGWREKTPAGFRFSAKFPQVITHEKVLKDCELETKAFVEAMAQLDDKLGPLLLQMPPQWTASGMADLEKFLPLLPPGWRYALEVRHKSWLTKAMFPELTELLKTHGIALCLVQHAWMPALETTTAPFVYIRWLGNRQDIPGDDYSQTRINRDTQLDRWASQITSYINQGLEIHGYFNNHYAGHSPSSVRALQARLKALGAPGVSDQPDASAPATLFDIDEE